MNDEAAALMRSDYNVEPRRVTVAFMVGGRLQSRSPWKVVRDRIITVLGGRYSHCELVFWLDDGHQSTFTVNYGRPLMHFEDKPYSDNLSWHLADLRCTGATRRRLYEWCCREWGRQVPYNRAGLYWNFLPLGRLWPIDRRGSSWFCSEMMATAFLECQPTVGELWPINVRPCLATPDAMARILHDQGRLLIAPQIRDNSVPLPLPLPPPPRHWHPE